MTDLGRWLSWIDDLDRTKETQINQNAYNALLDDLIDLKSIEPNKIHIFLINYDKIKMTTQKSYLIFLNILTKEIKIKCPRPNKSRTKICSKN